MLIILLFVIMFCVSVIIILSCKNMNKWLTNICTAGFIIPIVIMIICIPSIIAEQCNTEKKIYLYNLDYEALVKQCQNITSEYEDVSKSNIIQDVYNWNKDVYTAKYWSDSLWTNWFYNQKVVDSLKYINLEDYGL